MWKRMEHLCSQTTEVSACIKKNGWQRRSERGGRALNYDGDWWNQGSTFPGTDRELPVITLHSGLTVHEKQHFSEFKMQRDNTCLVDYDEKPNTVIYHH